MKKALKCFVYELVKLVMQIWGGRKRQNTTGNERGIRTQAVDTQSPGLYIFLEMYHNWMKVYYIWFLIIVISFIYDKIFLHKQWKTHPLPLLRKGKMYCLMEANT